MKLKIENVGKVEYSDIELNGITVIAGYNNTGKTTVLRSADLMLKTFHNFDQNISEERAKSIENHILQQDNLFDNQGFEELSYQLLADVAHEVRKELFRTRNRLITKEKFFQIYYGILNPDIIDFVSEDQKESLEFIAETMYSGMQAIYKRENSEYEKFLTEINVRSEFHQQAHQLSNNKESLIDLTDQAVTCRVKFQANKVIEEFGSDLGSHPVVYLETQNILDSMSRRVNRGMTSNLREMLLRERNLNKDEIIYEQYQETESNLNMLEDIFQEVMHGKLISELGILKYKEEHMDDTIQIKNVASGMKIFLLLYRLIENGSLKENSWILIDEPESNLHPDWHLKLAEILILLKIKMNIRIILSSHSPYFMRALEVKMADYGILDCGTFYLMEERNQGFVAKDVTAHTEEIYRQLYQPLELL
ncbi:MAG: ATP-binding protein [Eubacterium sp.]|nr:ATP-binding protein [Eubacterium sp.]